MRVASFNVGCHDLSYFIAKLAQDEILSSADIIFLQEIEEYHSKEKIKEELSHFGFYHFAPSRSLKGGEHGLAILSKIPITDYEVVDLPSFDLRFHSRRRIAIRGMIQVNGKPVQICNLHLDSRLNIKDRIKQLDPILAALRKEYFRTILAGDFNTIPLKLFKNVVPMGKSDQSKAMVDHLKSVGFSTFLEQPKYSLKSRGVKWLVDYIYVSNLKIIGYGTRANIVSSDHHPVWADIEIP